MKWLALLSQALDATHAKWGDSFVPDFILPCIPNLTHAPALSDVLLASTGMPSLGHTVVVEIGRRPAAHPAQGILVYSVQRRSYAFLHQKASKAPSPLAALLYSRDDTIEALWVQSELTSAIRRGWRPPGGAPNRGISLRFHRAALQAN